MFRRPATSIPINIHHSSERFGNYVLVFLGESVIALIGADIPSEMAPLQDHIASISGGFVIVFALKLIYFGAQPHSIDSHAARHSRSSGRVFVLMHAPIGWSLVCLGASLKVLSKYAGDAKAIKEPYLRLCSASVALTLIFFNIVRLSHPFKVRRIAVWTARLIIICAVALAPVYATSFRTRDVLLLFGTLVMLHAAVDELGFDIPEDVFHSRISGNHSHPQGVEMMDEPVSSEQRQSLKAELDEIEVPAAIKKDPKVYKRIKQQCAMFRL